MNALKTAGVILLILGITDAIMAMQPGAVWRWSWVALVIPGIALTAAGSALDRHSH